MARASQRLVPPSLPLPLGNGQLRPCAVRFSAKARRVRLCLSVQGQFTLVLPQNSPCLPEQLAALLTQFSPWAGRAWQRCQGRLASTPLALPQQVQLPLTGEIFRLYVAGGEQETLPEPQHLAAKAEQQGKGGRKAGQVRVFEEDSCLHLVGATEDIEMCCLALQGWLLAKAKVFLPPLVHAMAVGMDKKVTAVTVRHQRTRWGSCSSAGHISLNCCALLLPVADARYLILHELCHLEHMNHSPAYRAVIAAYEAAWRQRERALGEAWLALPPWVQWR
jgi:predicted metal-dependent hydrolase